MLMPDAPITPQVVNAMKVAYQEYEEAVQSLTIALQERKPKAVIDEAIDFQNEGEPWEWHIIETFKGLINLFIELLKALTVNQRRRLRSRFSLISVI